MDESSEHGGIQDETIDNFEIADRCESACLFLLACEGDEHIACKGCDSTAHQKQKDLRGVVGVGGEVADYYDDGG